MQGKDNERKITFTEKEKKVYAFLTEEMKTDESMAETLAQHALVKALNKKFYKAMIEVAYEAVKIAESAEEE